MSKFLLFLAGFKEDVINNSKIDKFHAIAIGCIMLFVWIYATLAWYLFFYTAFDMGLEAIPMGFLFGYFIICFDRALIASMVVQNNKTGIAFRFILAILLGVFLSQPVILKIYQQEVKRKAELLIGEENKDKQEELDSKYDRISEYQKEINRCDTLIIEAKQKYDNKENIFQIEKNSNVLNGINSGIIGYGTRAKKDEERMNEAKKEYDNTYAENNPKIQKYRDSIDALERKKEQEYNEFVVTNKNSGLIMQEKALMKLIQEDDTRTFFGMKSLWFRYCLLSIILALIELSALIAKLFFPFTSYKSELVFSTETEVANSNNKKDIYIENLGQIKTELQKSFSKLIQSFFKKTEPVTELKLDEMIEEWKPKKDMPLGEFCQSFMEKLLVQGIKLDTETKVDNKNKEFDYTSYIWMIPFAGVLILIAIPFVPEVFRFHFSSILAIIGLIQPYIFQKIVKQKNK